MLWLEIFRIGLYYRKILPWSTTNNRRPKDVEDEITKISTPFERRDTMTREEIRDVMESFKQDVMMCRSVETARDIERRVNDFCSKNQVLDEDNALLQSGFGEALYMMAAHHLD